MLFVVENKLGWQSYFPMSLCWKILPLEKGLKDQKTRINHMIKIFNEDFVPRCTEVDF